MQEIIYIATILCLIIVAYIDYKQKIIPDRMNIIIALLGILNLILNFQNYKIYIALAAITFAVFLFLTYLTSGGIGGGDIKLFTVLGLIFGTDILIIIVASFTIATIISIIRVMLKQINMKESIALAPYICFGTIICLIKIYIF